jgi:hypothetical protein
MYHSGVVILYRVIPESEIMVLILNASKNGVSALFDIFPLTCGLSFEQPIEAKNTKTGTTKNRHALANPKTALFMTFLTFT